MYTKQTHVYTFEVITSIYHQLSTPVLTLNQVISLKYKDVAMGGLFVFNIKETSPRNVTIPKMHVPTILVRQAHTHTHTLHTQHVLMLEAKQ